jgi:hypothetical protein
MPGSFTHLTGTTSFWNYWGGSSNATTHLLDAMHYEGLLRVVRREKRWWMLPCAFMHLYLCPAWGTRAWPGDGRCGRASGAAADARAEAAFCGSAVAGRADGCVAASETAVVSCVCRWRGVVLAGGREDCAACCRRQGEAADAIRSRGVGSGAFPALVGMGVSLRSLPAASETQARILCFAAALAGSGDWLGKSDDEGWGIAGGVRLRRVGASRE